KTLSAVLLSVVALQACDSEVASPGEGAFAPGASTGGGSGTGGGAGGGADGGTAAADCPTGFTNVGIVAGGTLRACQLPAKITGNFVVPRRTGTVYAISGRVDVGEDRGGNATAP